jgi:hypothetical protein
MSGGLELSKPHSKEKVMLDESQLSSWPPVFFTTTKLMDTMGHVADSSPKMLLALVLLWKIPTTESLKKTFLSQLQ